MSMLFNKEHEWVTVAGDVATIGITEHAQEQLGDVVYVELPEIGRVLTKGEESAVVESVKAASELYAVIGGEVVEINEALSETPEKVNEDAEGEAWFYKVKIADEAELKELMNRDAYNAYLETIS